MLYNDNHSGYVRKAMALFAIALTGCADVCSHVAETAYRLADVVVVQEDDYAKDPLKKWGLAGARDLTNVIARATGRVPTLCTESEFEKSGGGGKAFICLGNTRAAKAAGFDVTGLKDNQTFRLVTEKGRTFILAKTGTAASYGVAEFLRRNLDHYFITISGNDPVVKNPDAVATCCDVTRTPAIPVRNFYFKDCHDFRATTFPGIIDYARRLRTNGSGDNYPADGMEELEGRYRVSPQTVYHTYYLYCSDKKYFKDHPEYFRMNKEGKREARPFGELCLTNPDVKRICFESLCAFIEKDRAQDPVNYPCIYDFSEMDNSGGFICQCPECLKVVAKYNRKPGGNWEGGDAGLQLEFVNEMARKIRAKYPDVIIRTFAYVSTEGLPLGLKPEPNVIIQLCDLYSRCDHMRPLSHSFNAYRHALVRDWAGAAKHLQLWDYILYSGPIQGGFPEVAVDAIWGDMAFFRSVGMERFFMETEFRYQPFYELNNFVLTEAAFGTDKTLDELIGIYCRIYGKGAPKMRAAIDYLRKIIAENPLPDGEFDAWNTRKLAWRTVANMEKLRTFVKEAHTAEADPDCRAKMAEALGGIDRELMRLHQGVSETAAELKETTDEYFASEKEAVAGALSPLCAADRPRAIKMMTDAYVLQTLRFKDLPEVVAKAPKDKVLCVDWRKCYVAEAVDVMADPASECEKVMRLRKAEVEKTAAQGFPRFFFPHARPSRTKSQGKFIVDEKDLIKDGQYHWYRLGIGCLGEGGQINFHGNRGCFYLTQFYASADGAKVNPNWYEYWISLKAVEPLATNDFKTGLFIDRLALRRVDALE